MTNAGSGYVEQPTVTFSGGGGSGAAAYATVGSDTLIRSLGQNIAFTTPNGRTGFRVVDFGGATGTGHWNALGGTTGPQLRATGATSGIILTESAVPLSLQTGSTEQFRVNHTASAVNFVQVTGSATGIPTTISAQGSDANITLSYSSKGFSANHRFQLGGAEALRIEQFGTTAVVNRFSMFANVSGGAPLFATRGSDTNVGMDFGTQGAANFRFVTNTPSNGTGFEQARITHTASAVNYVQITGNTTGNTPIISVQGSDTNIGLAYITKGTGSHFLYGPSLPAFQVNSQAANANYGVFTSTAAGTSPLLQVAGTDTNVDFRFRTQGTGAYQFDTGSNGNTQLRIANTSSAVNFVQVTGAATGANPAISAQGSDANISLNILSKANGNIFFNAGTTNRVQIDPFGGVNLAISFSGGVGFKALATSNQVNFLQGAGAIAGSAPILSAQGSDTNIDISFVPKGTGLVSFGTYTGTALSIAGYIEIKDSGGTIRRLAVVA
jgi:hypothetical protein